MKMKKIKYAIISAAFVLGGMATSCDTLDIDNLNSYDESMVWDDVTRRSAISTKLSNVWKKGCWMARRLMACWVRLISCVPICIIGWFCIMAAFRI